MSRGWSDFTRDKRRRYQSATSGFLGRVGCLAEQRRLALYAAAAAAATSTATSTAATCTCTSVASARPLHRPDLHDMLSESLSPRKKSTSRKKPSVSRANLEIGSSFPFFHLHSHFPKGRTSFVPVIPLVSALDPYWISLGSALIKIIGIVDRVP